MPNANIEIIQNPARLERLHSLGLLDSPPDAAFDRLARLASQILEAPIAHVTLIDAERQFFLGAHGMTGKFAEDRQSPMRYSYCQHVVATNAAVVVTDARQHPLTYDNPAVTELDALAYAGVPIRTQDGEVIGSFCVVHNEPYEWTEQQIRLLSDLATSVMTEIELRDQLRKREILLTQVRDLEQLKTDMIHIAAHDLRNPLNVIFGFSELLRDHVGDPQKEFISSIQDATEDMNRIVSDILSMERIEEMAREGVHDHVALTSELQNKLAEFAPLARQAHIRLTFNIEADIYVPGDRAQLREAVSNLIGNALKYTPVDGQISVTLTRPDENHVVFLVRDTGYGIPEAAQKRLFQPFYRAHTEYNANIKGTGLGLHIVKNIVKRHHGEIIFSSIPGQGSAFGFALPAHPATPSALNTN